MAFPCAPVIPPVPGQQLPQLPAPPVLPPPVALTLQNSVPAEDPTQEQLPPVPAVELPRRVSEFSLSSPHVLFWLATLCRASYAPTIAPMMAAVNAVLPASTPITFIVNAAGLVPGYTVIKLPLGAIVVVSGTTNLPQWMEQILNSQLIESVGSTYPNINYKLGSIAAYMGAANTILGALVPLVPLDQQILFVGHSMGGAVAQLMHSTTGVGSPSRMASRCCTFAAPKPGDRRLVNSSRVGGQVFRAYITDQDFVPALPPDLGVFNLGVPAALQPVSVNWSNFKRPNGMYSVAENGDRDSANEPFLPALVGMAILAAAANNPLAPVGAHAISTYVGRFYNAVVAGRETAPTNWTDPTALISCNASLTAAGL